MKFENNLSKASGAMNPLASKKVLQALTEIESQQLAVRQKNPD